MENGWYLRIEPVLTRGQEPGTPRISSLRFGNTQCFTLTQQSRNQNQIHGYTESTDSFLQKAAKIAKMESLPFAHFAILVLKICRKDDGI